MAKINFNYYDGVDLYSDGIIEDKLLESYKRGENFFSDESDLFFYTTNIRQNIINWYPFKKNSTILEIGAGVGSITGALLSSGNEVISVEGSKKRASIIYERYKNYNNLTIYCGNYNSIEFQKKFDYIILIGVFEYARVFCNEKKAFDFFFKNICKNLKDNGTIIIAIENKLGLKYLNGMSEDHFKKPYVGIENYVDNNKYETFSRKELRDFFKKYGFNSKFYGVFPDYKLPSYLFSEDYLPSEMDYKKFTSFNYYDDAINFDLSNVSKSFIRSNLLIDVSNSFFIEITKTNNFSNIDYVTYQNYRNKEYVIGTSVGSNIIKFPVFNDSYNHLLKLEETHNILNKLGIPACTINHDEYKNFYNEKINGNTVLDIIYNHLYNNDIDAVLVELNEVINFILSISKYEQIRNPLIIDIYDIYVDKCWILPLSLFDLHLNNIIKNDKGYTLIDMEWVSKKQIPTEYNIYIIIKLLYENIPLISNYFKEEELLNKYNIKNEKIELFYKINHEFFNNEKKWLNIYINDLFKNKNNGPHALDYKDKYNNQIKKELFDYQLLSFYKNELNEKNKEIDNLKNNINIINSVLNGYNNKYNRKIYRLANIIQKIIDKVIPYNSFRSKLLSKFYYYFRSLLKLIFKTIKLLIKIVMLFFPFKDVKRKIVHTIHSSRKISKFTRECYYPTLPTRNYIDEDDCEYHLHNKTWSNNKIAVHIHMYYTDLANEFYNYLKNIPYKFDLYISTPPVTK